jgi:hypothetical protein
VHEDILQIDHKMTKIVFETEEDIGEKTTPLGLLCKREDFLTFNTMVLCLIEVDSSVEVIFDGLMNHIRSYEDCLYQDISHGYRGAKSLILLGTLFDVNTVVAEYDGFRIFHQACSYLRVELRISVLSLLLSKNGTGFKLSTMDEITYSLCSTSFMLGSNEVSSQGIPRIDLNVG